MITLFFVNAILYAFVCMTAILISPQGKLFSRGVTKAQFRRLLNFFDVDLTDKDCEVGVFN